MIFFSLFGKPSHSLKLLALSIFNTSNVLQLRLTNLNYKSTGKFGAVIASIPLPLFAALYCVLFAYTG
jgi:nucleobase transporter 1/2